MTTDTLLPKPLPRVCLPTDLKTNGLSQAVFLTTHQALPCACSLLGTLLLSLLLVFPLIASAQHTTEVPSEIKFANMKLELSADARKKIQTDVDALTRYEKYFNAKVERIDAYFPLIEEVLREEKVPDDIKYLVIQESALVGDAVSSSNAVGYWQFKQAAAEEVGLTINTAVDERMNIVAATRGAARYFKSNNARFDNWLYALMAYYEGPGGALKKTDQEHHGAQKMRLKGNTHWYLLKFLSHKIAFEQAVGKNPTPPIQLVAYSGGAGRTLAEIAQEFGLQEGDLEPYNKWLKQKWVPDDKRYHVIIPRYDRPAAVEAPIAQKDPQALPSKAKQKPDREPATPLVNNPTYFAERHNTDEFPMVEQGDFRGDVSVRINGIPGIIARKGEDVTALARRSNISSSQLVRYNDLTSKQATIRAGEAYYLKAKRNRALAHYHTVAPGETLWSISQRLGIKMKKLMRDNRMREEEPLTPGRVLWARFIRPEPIAITYRDTPPPVNDNTPVAREEETVSPPFASPQQAEARSETYSDHPVVTDTKPEPIPAPNENSRSRTVVVTPEDPKGLSSVEEDAVWRAEALPAQHTVVAGETLYSIARQYQLSPKELAAYNNLTFGDPLTEGQQLRTSPDPDRAQEEPTIAGDASVHEVQPGETMFQIARNYGVTIKELMEWNNKSSFTLNVGERLKILR